MADLPAKAESSRHGYTEEPVPMKPEPLVPHFMVSWYDAAGNLTDTCGECGHDLRHEAHRLLNIKRHQGLLP